jgi:hypothetical protein
MSTAARIGTEFAGYRIEALVGRGGTSTVYRAENPRLGIPVALKILNRDVADDESFRERFVRESRLAAGINHPNIIPIYDAGYADDVLYIAMRYVGGGDLRARLREGSLDAARTISIVSQAASGLDAAHARGLVHRDVKPANLMVDSGVAPTSPEIVYVSDFGLIKQVHSGGRPTPTGDFLGTIDYVAPEQIEGRAVDGRTDVYSLGCVLFECLTGRRPFERENDAAVLWAHMQEEPPAPSAVADGIPAGVDAVVRRALAKSPDARYGTCGELAAALADALAGGGGETGRITAALPVPAIAEQQRRDPRPPREPRRLPRVAALAAAFLALGAAGASAAFLAFGDRGAGATAAPRATTVTRTVTVSEAASRLRQFIPESIRESCRPAPTPNSDFDATFVCRPGRGIEYVRYSHAISGPLLTEHLYTRLEHAGLERPSTGERVQWVGSCSGEVFPAVEEWVARARAGHEAVGRTELGDSDGRIICNVSHGRARIEWTTALLGIYAYAQARDFRPLFQWWRTEAGPTR